MVEVIGAIMEVEVINKVVTKEEVGVVIKVAVEAVTQGAVEGAIEVAVIKAVEVMGIKTVVIIKVPKEVIQMNMTIEVKVDNNTGGTKTNIAGCKELVGRKDKKPIKLF